MTLSIEKYKLQISGGGKLLSLRRIDGYNTQEGIIRRAYNKGTKKMVQIDDIVFYSPTKGKYEIFWFNNVVKGMEGVYLANNIHSKGLTFYLKAEAGLKFIFLGMVIIDWNPKYEPEPFTVSKFEKDIGKFYFSENKDFKKSYRDINDTFGIKQ